MSASRGKVFAADSIKGEPVPGRGATKAMLLGPDVTPNFQMRKFVIQPGGAIPAHTNTLEHEQYVISGAAKVRIGDTIHDAKAGDVLFIPAGAPHWYETVGDEPYEFLCLGPNGEDTIEMIED